VEEYKKEGFNMLLRAFNDSDYLEKLTGLDELHRESEAIISSHSHIDRSVVTCIVTCIMKGMIMKLPQVVKTENQSVASR
jgi:hypothetical protein